MKKIQKTIILINILVLFSACEENVPDGSLDTSLDEKSKQAINQIDTLSQTNIATYSNIKKDLNTTQNIIDTNIHVPSNIASLGSQSKTVQAARAAIPFPTLPTNIPLESKYIPPQ